MLQNVYSNKVEVSQTVLFSKVEYTFSFLLIVVKFSVQHNYFVHLQLLTLLKHKWYIITNTNVDSRSFMATALLENCHITQRSVV